MSQKDHLVNKAEDLADQVTTLPSRRTEHCLITQLFKLERI